MKYLLKFLAAAIAAAILHLPAMATPVLDQSNPESAGAWAFCYTSESSRCGQSFKQDASTISGAGVYIAPGYWHAGTTLTISIFSGYGAAPSGLIATGSTWSSTGSSGWADVFWAPAAVSAATQYYMVLASDSGDILTAYSSSADYANGNALYGGSKTDWSDYDLVFRTFADDASAQQVPEPGSFALLGLGLAALGFATRKKRS